MKQLIAIVLTLFTQNSYAQQHVTIKGRVTDIPHATTIFFDGSVNVVVQLNESKEFYHEFKIPKSGFMLVTTDTSASTAIWVEGGIIEVELAGYQYYANQSKMSLRVKSIKGPADTEKFQYFHDLSQQLNNKFLSLPTQSRRDSVNSIYQPALESFILNNPSSGLSLWLLNQLKDSTKKANYFALLKDQDTNFLKNYRYAFARDSMIRPGFQFTDFTQNDLYGKPFTLSNLKSKYILIDFWSSTCGPCRRQHPELLKIYADYHAKGLDIVGVSLDNDLKDWSRAVQQDKLPWIHVSDLQGWQNVIGQKYFIDKMPFNVLLDEQRRVVAKDLRPPQLKEFLATLQW